MTYINFISNIEINSIAIRSEQKLPIILSPYEIEQLIDFYDHNLFISSRNKTIIDFMYSTGCRVSELINVEESDVQDLLVSENQTNLALACGHQNVCNCANYFQNTWIVQKK